jgi:hypothetical protein
MEVRTAIGQLYDYRWTYFRNRKSRIVMALLLPRRPEQSVIDLMREANVAVLWRCGQQIAGTIDPWRRC